MNDLTIIIPNYNGISYLKRCFKSLQNQDKEYLVVVVDNGSDDGSTEYVKENYPQHTLITNQENLGFSKAVNQGIKISKSKYVLLLNNDTELEPHCISNLLECMSGDDIFAVSSKMIRHQERDKMDDAGDEYTVLGWTLKVGDGKSPDKYTSKREVFSACAGAALYRRDVLLDLGLFDENFFAYLEDVDIGYRARINGYRAVYCPEAVVYHHTSSTTGSRYNQFKIKLSARNNIYLAYKNMPWPQLVVNLPFLMVGFLLKYLFFIKKGQGRYYRQGVSDGLHNLHIIGKPHYKSENISHYFKIEYLLFRNIFKFF